jgi:hypothetical protein
VQKDAVRAASVLNFTLGVTPLVAIHDTELDAIRIFDRRLPGREGALSFRIFEGKLIDEQSHSEWLPTGACSYGPLREKVLNGILSIDSMWFAWASLYRNTQIIPGKEF